jgi:hypothetical protein
LGNAILAPVDFTGIATRHGCSRLSPILVRFVELGMARVILRISFIRN